MLIFDLINGYDYVNWEEKNAGNKGGEEMNCNWFENICSKLATTNEKLFELN